MIFTFPVSSISLSKFSKSELQQPVKFLYRYSFLLVGSHRLWFFAFPRPRQVPVDEAGIAPPVFDKRGNRLAHECFNNLRRDVFPFLNCVKAKPPVLRTVATDGHRLARFELELPDGAAGMACQCFSCPRRLFHARAPSVTRSVSSSM